MKKIYLCGHTGSVNRGCEAIVRSTAIILEKCGATDVSLITSGADGDILLGVDKIVKLIPHPKKSIFAKGFTFLKRKFFGDAIWGAKHIYQKIFKDIEKDVILFNIGGDTYCYKGVPAFSFALNRIALERGTPNVFWGCSVDERILKENCFSDDINSYSYITPREEISFNLISQCVADKKKLYKVCDPAFHLNATETELPKNFKADGTLGINISPLVCVGGALENSLMFRNVCNLIDYVIENTNLNVCLIPHVYNVEKNTQDCQVLGKIYQRYLSSDRVSYVNREISCTEIKYIISKCKFFIGARTHSTIAAYSTEVPCVAISYSVKSRGIARDLFGTEEGYALQYKNIKTEYELKNSFLFLVEKEEEIRETYKKVLPEYRETIITSTKEILEKLGN